MRQRTRQADAIPSGNPEHEKGRLGAIPAALFAACPKCGSRSLFGGPKGNIVEFAPRCHVCGLDFSRFNVGDGPAAFLTLIIGALVVALALWVESAFRPPFWVHILLWVPFTTAAVLYGLRVGKAALLQAEYRNSAGEAVANDMRAED